MSVLSRTRALVPAQRQAERGVEREPVRRTAGPAVPVRRRLALVAISVAAVGVCAGTAVVLDGPGSPTSPAPSTSVVGTSGTDLRRDAALAGRSGMSGAPVSGTDVRRDAALAGRGPR